LAARPRKSQTARTRNESRLKVREIREYFIPDFSHWMENEAYKRAFERLMRDLNLGAEKKTEFFMVFYVVLILLVK
jgi:hypothetical protein